MVLKRKRARTEKGHYKKDDPSTPDINEAYVQEEPKPKEKKSAWTKPATVWYESREKEPSMFPCADINPIRNFTNGRLEYEVQADDTERFEKHHFFMNGRIVRKAT
tara:strand:- start:200 stop:517 length:318 start_codon:yes stop_codon:yes gene_type:complete